MASNEGSRAVGSSDQAESVEPNDISVVVATYCRPDVLRTCLEHLVAQSSAPREILVVDASPDDISRKVVSDFDGVRYLRNDEGMGTLPKSRQIGLRESTGGVVAYLDDDAYADADWLRQLAAAYRSDAGGVGGQARNGQPGEEEEGRDAVGRMYPNGTLTGNFAAHTGEIVEVDHLIGCNMSYRREALLQSGGIPAWPAGVSALREDLFLSLRVRDAGWHLYFTPFAGVRHIGAPQARGQRFDVRYDFTGHRNHLFVLVAHYGATSPMIRRYVVHTISSQVRESFRTVSARALRMGAVFGGSAVGLFRGVKYRRNPEA